VRVVRDTQVALSPLLWRGTPYRLLEAIRQRSDAQVVSGAALLEELADVLTRPSLAERLEIIGKTAQVVLADDVEAGSAAQAPPGAPARGA
jgi:predicted nucleic acid-binding protein